MGAGSITCSFCGKEIKRDSLLIAKYKSIRYCCPECYKTRRKITYPDGTCDYVDAPYKNKEWLQNEYIVNQRSAEEIATQCGIGRRTLFEWVRKHGLSQEKMSMISVQNKIPAEEVIDLYLNKSMGTPEIAKLYNTTGNTIASILKKNGVKLFSTGDATKRWLYGRGGIDIVHKIYSQPEYKVLSSCRQRGIDISEFQGFSTTESHMIRNSWEYKNWRNDVMKRDNYTCQKCGKRGGDLEVHHIKNFKNNKRCFDLDNGITLCKTCHSPAYPQSFHSLYGEFNNTPEQIKEFIMENKEENTREWEVR